MHFLNVTLKVVATLFFFVATTAQLYGQEDYEWKLVRPSNTGIPGEEIMQLEWAPNGKLWVAARWPFWGQLSE